jgi:hypothetical protein
MRAPCLLVVTCLGVTFGCAGPSVAARADAPAAAIDSDHDGLSDALEQELLVQFAPKFQTDPQDCAGVPAEFFPNLRNPVVAAEDGTIYGQATPRALKGNAGPLVELRYFHLWKSDCGRIGHPLDTEHVSVLIERDADEWRALYWYAAAHQDTMCDASQIARASTLGGEQWSAGLDLARQACVVSESESLQSRVRRGQVRVNARAQREPDRQPWRGAEPDERIPVDRIGRVANRSETGAVRFWSRRAGTP